MREIFVSAVAFAVVCAATSEVYADPPVAQVYVEAAGEGGGLFFYDGAFLPLYNGNATVQGTSPGPVNSMASSAYLDDVASLGTYNGASYFQSVSTQLETALVSSPFPDGLTGYATAESQNVETSLYSNKNSPALLNISAEYLSSSSSVNDKSLAAEGSSVIRNLSITGSIAGGINYYSGNFGDIAPNTYIVNSPDLIIELNEQNSRNISERSGDTLYEILDEQTYALDVDFQGFPIGSNLLYGAYEFGYSYAEYTSVTAGVPEVSTWRMMLAAFAAVGAVLRARRTLALVSV